LAMNKRSTKHRLFCKLKYILNHTWTVYTILCWYYNLHGTLCETSFLFC
jgi:hypothetical protein